MLIAVDFEHMWMLLEDLGETKSLADAILVSDPELAMTALSPWVSGIGQLHPVSSGANAHGSVGRAQSRTPDTCLPPNQQR
jgi:hypothetical protein